MRGALALGLSLVLAACSAGTPSGLSPAQKATTEDAAGVAALEAMLASHSTATQALQAICNAKHKSQPPAVVADKFKGTSVAPLEEVRQMLRLDAGEEPHYRHVAIKCGGETLSLAHNWYIPARLTPEMNHTLTNTDAPFGRVAAPLRFKREERDPGFVPALECPGNTVSEHRALLRLPDGRPLAFVVECYTPASTQWSLD